MDKYGVIKVATISPNEISIGNPIRNAEIIVNLINKAKQNEKPDIMVFPELCLTGYSCGDLFFQNTLLNTALNKALDIAKYVEKEIVFIGLPIKFENEIYNCAAVLNDKRIIAIIPKTHIPNHGDCYEKRYFTSSLNKKNNSIKINNTVIPFDTNILFKKTYNNHELVIGCEIGEDALVPISQGTIHCINGANLVVNLSASNEVVSRAIFRTELVKMTSATNICGYAYCSAQKDETTSDTVFSGHKIIATNGDIINERKFPNDDEIICGYIDVEKLNNDRIKSTTFNSSYLNKDYNILDVTIYENIAVRNTVSITPFIPENINERAEEIMNIQAMGLAQRLKKIHCEKIVLGISGGLDSTLALLCAIRAFEINNYDRKNIIGITMPCFGTTSKTLNNSLNLMEYLGIDSRTINIKAACEQHLKDISHPLDVFDIAFENAQARERTQVLMDVANQENALVVGTGDLSELALGWCTYNGDHMSMYCVNGSIPKTLVRHIVKYYADFCDDVNIKNCLFDILNTPISPELLPPDENGNMVQKTEESIGNYTIHDFTIYYFLRYGFGPKKILDLFMNSAKENNEWKNITRETVVKNLKIFYKRFFNNQFKRNCVPDGAKVGTLSLSPRTDWRMPSDANNFIWQKELNELM